MSIMKALSVKQPYANMIASGQKTIETRLWYPEYRGDILIVSSKRPDIHPAGFALAIVELVECRLMTVEDEVAAKCEIYWGAFSWMLENIRPIKNPFPVRGQLKLYDVNVPDEVISNLGIDHPDIDSGSCPEDLFDD